MSKEKLIDLEHEQLGLVKVIIRRHIPGKTVWAYGSRVTWKASDISDLDLAVFDCSPAEIGDLKEALEESNLLVSVDVMDWGNIPEKFRENIKERYVVVQESSVPEGWREVKLGEICEVIGGGTPKTDVPEYWNGNIPWLSPPDFTSSNRWVKSTQKTITDRGLNESSTKMLEAGDLIISARGTVGALAQLKKPMTFSQTNYGLKAIPKFTNNDFLFYAVKHNLQGIRKFSYGAVFNTITKNTFNEIQVSLPPLSEQEAIAEVLSSLDDKIDLLHRQNKTLEDMAQALFRKWFVEGANERLQAGKLGDVIELRYGKGLQKSERTGKGFPVVGSSGIIDFHSDYLVKGPGIVIGRKGTLGKIIYLWDNFYPIDTTYFVLPKSQSNGLYFEYFLLKKIDFANMNTDSAVPGLNRSVALRTEITIPKESKKHKFNKEIASFFSKIFFNQSQIKTLKNLRDTLLPALMNRKAKFKNKNLLTTLSSFVVPRDYNQNLIAAVFRDLGKNTRLTTTPSSALADMLRSNTLTSSGLERFRFATTPSSSLADMLRSNILTSSGLERFRFATTPSSALADMLRSNTLTSSGLERFRFATTPSSALADMLRSNILSSSGLERFRFATTPSSALADMLRSNILSSSGLERFRFATTPSSSLADMFRSNILSSSGLERLRLNTISSLALLDPEERIGFVTKSYVDLLESCTIARVLSSILPQRLSIDISNFRFNIDPSPVTKNFEHSLIDDPSINANLTKYEQEELLSSIRKLDIDKKWLSIIEQDFKQIPDMIHVAPLYRIVLYYKILENLLLGLKFQHPKLFSQAKSTLGDKNPKLLVDVAHAAGLLRSDGKACLELVRYYRNYIHSDKQIKNNDFCPDEGTAQLSKICFILVIKQITDNQKN